MRHTLLFSILCFSSIPALEILPIRVLLADEDYLLQLCLGNLFESKVPGRHNLADLKTSLRNHRKIHCGPGNTAKSKSLLDLLLLGDDACSSFRILYNPNTEYGEGIGGIDLVLQTIQPHCSQKPYPDYVPPYSPITPPTIPPTTPPTIPPTIPPTTPPNIPPTTLPPPKGPKY